MMMLFCFWFLEWRPSAENWENVLEEGDGGGRDERSDKVKKRI
jgi:hypothetical protein